MLLQHYRIATRIGLVVGAILVLMLVLAAVEIKGLNSIRNSLNDIVGSHYQRLQLAQDLRFLARHNAVLVRNLLLVDGRDARAHELERFEQGEKQYKEVLQQLLDIEHTGQGHKLVAAVVEGGEITFDMWRRVIAAESESEFARGGAILTEEVRSHQWGWLESLNALVRLEEEHVTQSADLAIRNYETTKTAMALINVLAVGAGLYFVVSITASIVGPLRDITRKVDRIAGGDFSTRVESNQTDEIGALGSHINRMVEKLWANEEELEEYRHNLEELIEWRTGEVNDQRERFISVLIHDLKGPLVPIIGFSRLLMTKKKLREEKIAEYAKAIHESSTKLETTIERISQDLREKRLAYSFDKEPFDIEDLLCSVIKSCQPELEVDNIELRLNDQAIQGYLSSGKILYAGDIGKIRSLIENLIGNAVKYAETHIDVTLTRHADTIEFIVDDDGVGITPPYQKKIFEEYYQIPGSKNGTGVGLYSVKRIVDHYQGEITVTSSPSSGARFVVNLPMPKQLEKA